MSYISNLPSNPRIKIEQLVTSVIVLPIILLLKNDMVALFEFARLPKRLVVKSDQTLEPSLHLKQISSPKWYELLYVVFWVRFSLLTFALNTSPFWIVFPTKNLAISLMSFVTVSPVELSQVYLALLDHRFAPTVRKTGILTDCIPSKYGISQFSMPSWYSIIIYLNSISPLPTHK